MNTAILFRDALSELSKEDVNGLVKYLLGNVRMISIVCTSPSFAIRLFQVLNARGLDLSPADLVKSHLMKELPDDEH